MIPLMLWYGVVPRIEAIVVVPSLILILILTTLGLALWLSALAVQYRDVSHGLGFAIQALMYISPVIYSDRIVPDRFRIIYGVNPIAGVIAGMRAVVLGTGPLPGTSSFPVPWSLCFSPFRASTISAAANASSPTWSELPPISQPSRCPRCLTR